MVSLKGLKLRPQQYMHYHFLKYLQVYHKIHFVRMYHLMKWLNTLSAGKLHKTDLLYGGGAATVTVSINGSIFGDMYTHTNYGCTCTVTINDISYTWRPSFGADGHYATVGGSDTRTININ